MSDTPRVDQVHWNHAYLKEEAYKLERELNAANERIKRLETAGDEMYRWITVKRLCSIDCTEAWDQAKEAKP